MWVVYERWGILGPSLDGMWNVWGPGQALPSPIVRIGQLEPGPSQLDVLLTDDEGQDLLI